MAKDLTVKAANALKAPGWHLDSRNLYIVIKPTGAKSWVFRYRDDGKLHDMGLGSFLDVSQGEARDERDRLRKLRLTGTDPLADKAAAKVHAKLDRAKALTFKAAAERYIAANKAAWKNDKHAAQWTATLDTYAFPTIGALPVASIETGHVTEILTPIWSTKNETASRVRGRVETVLDYCAAHGWRVGPNPAAWRGHLDKILPARSKVAKAGHHAALVYDAMPAFFAALQGQGATGALALQFAIATAARTSEVIGAAWDEIDLDTKLWTVPELRMKAGKAHRVPLNAVALDVLRRLQKEGQGAFVFPGIKGDRPISNVTMLKVLERMDRSDLTTHGFRSTFRDWTAEQTGFSNEVAEMALAHTIESKAEAAYRRGDLLDKRRELMDLWSAYLLSASRSVQK